MGNREKLVSLDSWSDVIHALDTEYTVSLRDVCQMLKSSRPWVNTYIKPFVRHIYLSRTGFKNYVRLAANTLERNMTESIWLHRGDVEELLNNAVVSVTKQTKQIPVTFFVPESVQSTFSDERQAIREALWNTTDISEARELLDRYEEILAIFVNSDVDKQRLFNSQVSETARGKVQPMPAELPEHYLYNMSAPHDLKGYGDVDETVYRTLFREGCVRIEMRFTAENGKEGKKVFYIPDPEPIDAPYAVEGFITVSELAWQAYNRGVLNML